MENAIFNDDCFNVLPKIEDKSIQLILVDLPYGQTNCEWDIKIDLNKMWEQIKRVLKPNGQVLFFTTTKFGYELIKSNEKWFRSDIVWEKNRSVGFLNARRALLRKHEMIYLFHSPTKPKDLNWIYNPQMVKGVPYSRGKIVHINGVYGDKAEYTHENLTGDRFPTSIIKLGITSDNSNRLHPTQKPVEICEWLIKTYSNEGDVVLDFVMGSGSTIMSCINTNRKYIGVEMNEEYFNKAKKIIEN